MNMKKIIVLVSIFLIGINSVLADTVKFKKCVDGDTFKATLNKEEVTIRLLAIDTPESVKSETEVAYYGKEASEYTCSRLKKANKIVLEYDKNSDKFDKYDRLLAWVFVDDALLQEELVEKGYAKIAYLYDDYKYTDILTAKQEIASSKNLGIWNQLAKEKYEKENNITNDTSEYENKEIAIIVIIITIFIMLFKKFFKKSS